MNQYNIEKSIKTMIILDPIQGKSVYRINDNHSIRGTLALNSLIPFHSI